MEYDIFSSSGVRSILKNNGLWLSKNRGQNFLVDRNISKKIIDLIPVDIPIFEVGTGLGALTDGIGKRLQEIYSIEIDEGIFNANLVLLQGQNIHLIKGDFLKFDVSSIKKNNLYFVANLPYSISGVAIKKFIDCDNFSQGIIMLQNEFVDRMKAGIRTKSYGILSILSQIYLEIEELMAVNRNSFFPVPSVDSKVVRLKKRKVDIDQDDLKIFLFHGFQSRRKKLINNLKRSGFTKDILEELNIPPLARPEEINVETWLKLYRIYKERGLDK